jgi:Ca-activated chloride channel family protein
METLADNGNYAYVDDLDEARKLFEDDLTSTLQAIALDAKVQVDFNPDVVAYYRLIGYKNRDVADQDFRNDAVDAGEIGAGHSATALYAVMFRPNTEGRIATVQLCWEDPDTHQGTEIASKPVNRALRWQLQHLRFGSQFRASRSPLSVGRCCGAVCRNVANFSLGCRNLSISPG